MLSSLNQIAELKRARKEIDEEIAELEGRVQCAEWLKEHKPEILAACQADARQASFEWTAKERQVA